MTDPAKELEKRMADRRERMGAQTVTLKAHEIHGGVTATWLAEVFNLDPKTVRKRLAECPPISTSRQGPKYSLPQAAAYLVKPVFDVQKYLKSMRPEELPSHLQDQYWAAKLKRQRWEENAKELWRTDQIMETLAAVFMTMKSTMMLWTEEIERNVGLTADQRTMIINLVDELQNEIKNDLLKKAVGSTTQPIKAEEDEPVESDGSDLI